MAKVKEKKEALQHLFTLVQKEAALAQTNISGVPGQDTNVSSVSESTETTNQNAVGPEELSSTQGPHQKPSKDDSSIPLNEVKQGSENINKLANDLMSLIDTKVKEAKAQTNISGKPGADTNISSVSESTETTNQNAVGPEELSPDQGPEQKPSKDKSAPTKTAADMGKAFFEALTKRAAEIREVSAQENHLMMCKAAGRADLETLVQHALTELETQKQAQEAQLAFEAEKQGAALFEELYKQAAYELKVETEQRQLHEKIAALEEVVKSKSAPQSVDGVEKLAQSIADALAFKLQNQPAK